MKKKYSLLILLASCVLRAAAQPGWTVYNNTNSALPNTTVYQSVVIDQSGTVWAGGSYSGLCKFNGSTWSGINTLNSTILHDDVYDMVVDNSNKLWVGNYKGLSVYNGTSFTNYDTISAGFKGMTPYKLGKDNNGTIWVSSSNGSTYKGIATYNGSTWTNLTGFPSQIASSKFDDFAFTSSNDAWIASNPGITKYSGSTFTFYPKATTGLWTSACVAVDASGVIWAGGFDGLLKNNAGTYTFYDNVAFFGFTSNTFFYDILPDGNILWIATAKGLLKFDRTTATVLANYNSTNSPLADNCVVSIARASNGDIWLGTTVGVVKMVPSQVGAVSENEKYPVEIFPNPVADYVLIRQPEVNVAAYKITTLEGCIAETGAIDSRDTKVNVGKLNNGCYFLYLLDDKGLPAACRKVIVSH